MRRLALREASTAAGARVGAFGFLGSGGGRTHAPPLAVLAQTLMPHPPGAGPMPAARRVVLAPPEAWDEARLMEAARRLPEKGGPLRPGDGFGDLVVLRVEPDAPAAPDADTVFDIQPRPRPANAPLVDLAILLDASESMALPWSADLTRSDAAREALSSFLRTGGAGVGHVSVLAFARDARILAGPAPPRGLTDFEAPEPAGPARTGPAMDAALAHLSVASAPDRVQAILLLTDAAGEAGPALEAAERAGRLGVPIHALVFAPEADPLFEEMARRSRGSAQVAALPLTLDFVHQPGSDAP